MHFQFTVLLPDFDAVQAEVCSNIKMDVKLY